MMESFPDGLDSFPKVKPNNEIFEPTRLGLNEKVKAKVEEEVEEEVGSPSSHRSGTPLELGIQKSSPIVKKKKRSSKSKATKSAESRTSKGKILD